MEQIKKLLFPFWSSNAQQMTIKTTSKVQFWVTWDRQGFRCLQFTLTHTWISIHRYLKSCHHKGVTMAACVPCRCSLLWELQDVYMTTHTCLLCRMQALSDPGFQLRKRIVIAC
jgi:hypothetical protein